MVADGNTVVLVDHDTQVLSHSDWIIELGPGAGAKGGTVIAKGTPQMLKSNPASRIAPFLGGREPLKVRAADLFGAGAINMRTSAIHTVRPLEVSFPKGRLTAVTGVSGSGKTTMVLESLVPGVSAWTDGRKLPEHVLAVDAPGIKHIKLIDATPIGINVRSTVATYAGIHDELRKVFARTEDARAGGWKAGDFSYNTGRLRCPVCDGTGSISLDVQFLPDVDIPCPDCHGSRYSRQAFEIRRPCGKAPVKSGMPSQEGGWSLPELMEMSVDEVLESCSDLQLVRSRLQVLHDLGLGYLTLGEATPSLSGGEAQRLKLASEMGREQADSIFVFDEPTIGLHPLDVQTLMEVFRHLIANGATVIVIEHDLDVIRSADFVVDMGPGGGLEGGRIVASGAPSEIAACPSSLTGRYL